MTDLSVRTSEAIQGPRVALRGRCVARHALRSVAGRLAPAVVALLAALLAAPAARAQDESPPFLLFDMPRAELELRFESFDSTTDSGGSKTRLSRATWTEVLNLADRFTVYHPRLVDVTLNLGGQLSQSDENGTAQDSQLTTWNVTARFLKEHPYSLQYSTQRSQSETSISATQAATSVLTARNAQLHLKQGIVLPVSLVLEHDTRELRSTNLSVLAGGTPSENSFTSLEERTDTDSISSRKSWDAYFLNWAYEAGHYESKQETAFVDALAAFDFHSYELGTGRSASLDNSFYLQLNLDGRSQTDAPQFSDDRATLLTGGNLYESWSNTLALQLTAKGRREMDYLGAAAPAPGLEVRTVETREVGLRLEHRLFRSVFTNLRAHRTTKDSQQFSDQTDSQGFGTRYQKSFPDGQVYASYDHDVAHTVGEGSTQLRAINEQYFVSGITPIKLLRPHVVLTATERPVVTDISGLIIYVENTNYRVYQIGVDTFIEPLAANPIPPGQILISYLYVEPRADRAMRTRRYTLGFRYLYFEPYLRVTHRSEEATTGDVIAADVLLNPGSLHLYGVTYRQQFGKVEPVVQVENESNHFLLDPFDRQQRDLTVRIDIALGLAASVYRNQTSYDHLAPDRQDSRTTATGADLSYTRGRHRVDVLVSSVDRLVGPQSNEVLSTQVRWLVYYGRWTFESVLGAARERTDDVTGQFPFLQRDSFVTNVRANALF